MNKKILRTLGIIAIPLMYIVFFLAIKYISFIRFSYDLLFFATLGIAYVSLHFFLDIKKMYEWIFKFRYPIVIAVFIVMVAGGYHGSSISVWNSFVNPNTQVENGKPILGIPRGIRSDEWLVNSTYNLSQADEKVNFSSTNSLINGKDTKVNFYPRLIVKDFGMIMHPEHWGSLFLPKAKAFSYNWYFSIFAAFLVAIELCMIITKRNKLYSVLGAFLLVISAPIFWWNTCAYILYGGAALLIIHKFINTKSVKIRILLASLLGWVASCYVSIMYPAWMIPYAYLFVSIFIWMLIDNKDKIKWKDLLYLIITIVVCAGLFLPFYFGGRDVFEIVSNTVYPGKRVSYGGGNWKLLFTYISTTFFPYIHIGNPCEYSQYLSLFPIPIILGVYYLIKKLKAKKIDWFLLLTCTFAIGLTIWCAFPLPKFLSQITLFTMTTTYRAQMVVGYACIFILIYILSRYQVTKTVKTKPIDNILLLLLALLITGIATWCSSSTINLVFENCITSVLNIISFVIFIPIFYLLLRNNKKTNMILFILLIGVNLISSVAIAPISKGLNVLYEKPFAKEIQNIVAEEPDARFITVDSGVILSNYILVNGGRSVTSTNFVPNLDLWHELDPEEKYNSVYNRYEHVITVLTNDQTSFELAQEDTILLNLNYDDMCKIGIDYIASIKEQKSSQFYEEIYNYDNSYIYKTKCNSQG